MHAAHGVAKDKAVPHVLLELLVGVDVLAVAQVDQVRDEPLVVGVDDLVAVLVPQVRVGGGGQHVAQVNGGTTATHDLEVDGLHVQRVPGRVVSAGGREQHARDQGRVVVQAQLIIALPTVHSNCSEF